MYIVPPQTEQVNSLRPLEQLQAPLTKKEEAYLTRLIRIKLKQSDDKQFNFISHDSVRNLIT